MSGSVGWGSLSWSFEQLVEDRCDLAVFVKPTARVCGEGARAAIDVDRLAFDGELQALGETATDFLGGSHQRAPEMTVIPHGWSPSSAAVNMAASLLERARVLKVMLTVAVRAVMRKGRIRALQVFGSAGAELAALERTIRFRIGQVNTKTHKFPGR
jgi:hypothetical protein